MKKIILTLLVTLFTLSTLAQSDFDIAQSFMSKKGIKLVPNERSLTRGTDVPYNIFNGSEDKGFCIVVNGKVVGYDTNNTVDIDNMPCCFKELLDIYSNVTSKGKTRSNTDYFPLRETTPIEPLITTHWGQVSPFNDLLEKKTGICVLVAWCQILHYFRVPQTLMDYVVNDSLTLPITYFDHDKMVDKYDKNATDEEKYEVAKLFYYYKTIDIYGILEYFGLEVFENKPLDENYNYNFNNQRDSLLEEGIPIWSCGGNHAFIIDGRDSEGRYHINMGWSGTCDGYYTLPDNRNERDASLGYAYGATVPIYFKPVSFNWSYSGTSNIGNIISKANNENVYNLQGRKVGNSLEGLPKGIYIQNNKKRVVK